MNPFPGPPNEFSMEFLMRSKLLIAVRVLLALGAAGLCARTAAQAALPAPAQVWTWETVKDRFELNNTTLQASRLNIDELKAQEITAHLRPNPDFTLSADGTQIAPSHGVWTPVAGTFISPAAPPPPPLGGRPPYRSQPRGMDAVRGHLHLARRQLPLRAPQQTRAAL